MATRERLSELSQPHIGVTDLSAFLPPIRILGATVRSAEGVPKPSAR
jgi:hypothetical protein